MRGLKVLGWIAGIGALLLLVGWLMARARTNERADELTALLTGYAAVGRGTVPADLVVPLDADVLARREAFVDWSREGWPTPVNEDGIRPDAWLRFHLGSEPEPPAHGFEDHEAARTHAERLGALLEEGPLALGVAGLLAARPEADLRADLAWQRPVWTLLQATDWLAIEAMIGADRERAFRGLDRLHEELAQPHIVLECMVASVVASQRDAAYLRDALEHGAQGARMDRWLAEPPAAFEVLADGLRGDRILYTIPLARDIVDGADAGRKALSFWRVEDPLQAIDRELYFQWDAPRDAVRSVRTAARTEAWLRGFGDDDAVRQAAAWNEGRGLLQAAIPMWRGVTTQWIGRRAEHRAARLVVHVLRFDAAGALPEDDAALREALGPRLAGPLLEATPRDALLRYERSGEGSVRVGVDPDRPLPDVLRVPGGPTTAAPSRLGAPPYGLPLRYDAGGIDIHLPAR